MTITVKTLMPGAPAIGRRLPPTSSAKDFRLPMHDLVTAPAPAPAAGAITTKGNTALGRREQVMVVDRIDIHGIASAANPSLFSLEVRNYLDDTAPEEYPFFVTNFTAAASKLLDITVEKFGLAVLSASATASVTTPEVGRSWPASIGQVQYSTLASQSADLDGAVQCRYLSQMGAMAHGVRNGFWGYAFPLVAGTTAVINAPGAGKHLRVRTLIVMANGGSTASHRLTIGSGATPTSAIIQEFYSSPAADGFGVLMFLTDQDIPLPENSALSIAIDSDFAFRTIVLAGAEICNVAGHNHLNLTGVPQ